MKFSNKVPSALRAAVKVYNSEHSPHWLLTFFAASRDYGRTEDARRLVASEYSTWMASTPTGDAIQSVRAWIIDNAKDATRVMNFIDNPKSDNA